MPRLIDHGLRDGKKAKKAKAKKTKPTKPTSIAKSQKFTQQLADEICSRLADGESLMSICRTPGMPKDSTVYRWSLDSEHPFSQDYARAREIGYRRLADEILEISDNATNDYVQRLREEGEAQILVDHDHISRSRLRVESRKWYLSKVLPKIYGDKIQHEGGDKPIVHNVGIGWMTKEQGEGREWA